MTDLYWMTAVDLARAIRERRVSAVELVDACLQRIEAHNPRLNAIVTLDAEGARRRAEQADEALARGEWWGPLHGVPVTIKDAFETAGLRTTSGFRPLANHVPHQDATVVARLRAAGAIVLGKTNMPELAGDAQTNNHLFGRTNNPWDLSRTPGGSSGGSAVAIATGMSALEVGSDIGGSVRTPAHFCGVYSLKPTDHLVSWAGHIPPFPGQPLGLLRYLLSVGPLARSVQDLRLALTIIAGPDPRHTDIPPISMEIPPKRELRQLKLAWGTDFGIPVSADTRNTIENLARNLSQLGCRVEECNPPGFDFVEACRLRKQIEATAVFMHRSLLPLPRFALRGLANPVGSQNPDVQGTLRGAGATLGDYARALSRRDVLLSALDEFLSGWDAWLCPVAPIPAYPHVETLTPLQQMRATVQMDGQPLAYVHVNSRYTSPFNVTGHPVVVIPAGQSREGLPIGIQIVGQRWHDLALLNVAEQLAEVTGPFQPPPAFA